MEIHERFIGEWSISNNTNHIPPPLSDFQATYGGGLRRGAGAALRMHPVRYEDVADHKY